MYPNSAKRAGAVYTDNSIRYDGPLGLIARVYQIATHEARKAQQAVECRDFRAKADANHRLLRCLDLLQSHLDMERGGDVALNLDRIYGYLIRVASLGNIDNDASRYAEVAKHLAELGSAWAEVARRPVEEPSVGEDTPTELVAAAK